MSRVEFPPGFLKYFAAQEQKRNTLAARMWVTFTPDEQGLLALVSASAWQIGLEFGWPQAYGYRVDRVAYPPDGTVAVEALRWNGFRIEVRRDSDGLHYYADPQHLTPRLIGLAIDAAVMAHVHGYREGIGGQLSGRRMPAVPDADTLMWTILLSCAADRRRFPMIAAAAEDRRPESREAADAYLAAQDATEEEDE